MSDTHWRNSMKPARFFFMDARAAVPFVVVLLHLRWYTLVGAAITTLIFYIMETRGLGFAAALRAFRVWLVTRKRPNVMNANKTRLVDYGFEPDFDRKEANKANQSGEEKKSEKPKAKMVKTKKAASANQSSTKRPATTVKPAAKTAS